MAERSRLRFGSVPPSVKVMAPNPVYAVLPAGYDYDIVKPAVYDPYYGVNYVPSSGRDSWSAYHFCDTALDDNDDIVVKSRQKDSDFLREVNRKLAATLADVPTATVKRAAPTTSFKTTQQAQHAQKFHRGTGVKDGGLDTVYVFEDRGDLERTPLYSDSASLDDIGNLKGRLRDTSGLLEKQRLLLARYRNDSLAEEVKAKAQDTGPSERRRFERATSLQPEHSPRKLSAVRSRIRDVLERSRKN